MTERKKVNLQYYTSNSDRRCRKRFPSWTHIVRETALKNIESIWVRSHTPTPGQLTEEHGYVVGVFDDFRQDLGVDFLDPVGQVHRFQGGEEIQHAGFVHEVSLVDDGLLLPVKIFNTRFVRVWVL